MSHSFSSFHLKEVIEPIERPEIPIPDKIYRQLGVKLWGEGAYERESIDGIQTKYKTLSRVEAKDIVVNKIWARNGSVAVVPESLSGCYVSGEFPTFKPIEDKLEPLWFHWLTKTKEFWRQCDEKSQGTSGKNRIRPERFLEIEIPLPPLEEQRRIVARIEELAARIEQARELRRRAVEEARALMKSAIRQFVGGEPSEEWTPLRTFVEEIENGWSPSCEKRPARENEWGVLKVGCVSFGVYNDRENKALPGTMEPRPNHEVHSGDFLMSRANTIELVGACAIVEETRPMLMLSDKIFRFKFNKDIPIDPSFLGHVLKSPALRKQIQKGSTGTSPTMKNISKDKVLNLLIPSKAYEEQKRIGSTLNAMQYKLDALRRHQSETAAALEALLPAVLEQALQGEL